MDLIEATKFRGRLSRHGKTTLTQLDGTVRAKCTSCRPARSLMAAGFDLRREEYEFDGDARRRA